MALFDTIPPWLHPANWMGAMESGARLGLSQREQDFREQEEQDQIAERARLAKDQIAKQERLAHLAADAKLTLGKASLDLKAAQMDALRAYQSKSLEARTAYNQGRLDNSDLRTSVLSQHYNDLNERYGDLASEATAKQAALDKKNADANTLSRSARAEIARHNAAMETLQNQGKVVQDNQGNVIGRTGAPDSVAIAAGNAQKKAADDLKASTPSLWQSLKSKWNMAPAPATPMTNGPLADLQATNAPTGLGQPATRKRIKVRGPLGPNGKAQMGTVEEGDTLPDGWAPVE